MKTQDGFTLLELLVVLAVAAVLVGYAIPSFQKLVRSNRLATQANSFLTALYTARSEAVRRSTTVTVCASSNQSTCDTAASAASWSEGWIVFVPATGQPSTTATGGTLLLVQQGLTGSNTMGALDNGSGSLSGGGNPASIDYITYNNIGIGSTTGYVELCDVNGTKTVPATAVLINAGGRPQSSPDDNTGAVLTCPVP